MELGAYMERMSMKVLVEWSPRSGNKEADALANRTHQDIIPEIEIMVGSSASTWDVLQEALAMGRVADQEAREANARGQRRRKLEERVRVADPW